MRKSLYILLLSAALIQSACGGRLEAPKGAQNRGDTGETAKTCPNQCAQNEKCDNGKCVTDNSTNVGKSCDPAITNSCGVGYECDPTSKKCIVDTSCNGHDDCADDKICVSNKCITGTRCNKSDECPQSGSFVCNEGACIDLSVVTDLCKSGQIKCGAKEKCENNACVPDCADPCGGVCCDASQVCFQDQCVAPCNTGEEICGTAASPLCCAAGTEGCFSGACVTLGDHCGGPEEYCQFTRYCDIKHSSCIRYEDNQSDLCLLPAKDKLEYVVELDYSNPKAHPKCNNIDSIALVGDVTGPSGEPDGKPDIIINTYKAYNDNEFIVRVISGTAGPGGATDVTEYWNSADISEPFKGAYAVNLALGDVNGDGKPDIIVPSHDGYVYAVEGGTGKRIWKSQDKTTNSWNAAAIADLDFDGTPEIIQGSHVLDGSDGHTLCKIERSPTPAGLDLDGSGNLEILVNGLTYSYQRNPGDPTATCTKRPLDPTASPLQYPKKGNYSAAADVLTDASHPGLEIVTVSGSDVTLADNRGNIIWTYARPGDSAGPPTIADFDGDEELEIAFADRYYYIIVETDGTEKWRYKTDDFTSGVTGSSVFDFDGDGKAEVVYEDEQNLRIFKGDNVNKAGANPNDPSVPQVAQDDIKLKFKLSSHTALEYPTIADVDGDGHAEVLTIANGSYHGLRVLGDKDNAWVPTRKVWNQHAYTYTGITDSGTIPSNRSTFVPHWKKKWSNNYRQNVQKENTRLAPNVSVKLNSLYNSNNCNATSNRTISYTITNMGSRIIPSNTITNTIEVKENGTGTYTTIDSRKNSSDLAPGESETVSFDWDISASYQGKILDIRVVADKDNDAIECDETNNIAEISNVSIAAPDLIPILPSKANVSCDVSRDTVVVNVELHNLGGATALAGSAKLRVTVDTTVNGVKKTFIKEVSNTNDLPKNAHEALTVEIPIDSSLQNKALNVTIEADPDNTVTECIEENNSIELKQGVSCLHYG